MDFRNKDKLFLNVAILVFIFLFMVPMLVEAFMLSGLFDGATGKGSDWLGFWGGYLGAILSIIGVYISLIIQIKHEKQQQMEDEQRAKIVESYYKIASLIRGVSAGLNTNYILFNLKDNFLNKYYRDKLRDEIEATTNYFVKFRDEYNSENFIFDYEGDDKKWLETVNKIDEEFANQVLSKIFPTVLGQLDNFESSLSKNDYVKNSNLSASQKKSLLLLSDGYQSSRETIESFQDKYTDVIDEIKNRIDEVYKQK